MTLNLVEATAAEIARAVHKSAATARAVTDAALARIARDNPRSPTPSTTRRRMVTPTRR